MEEGAKSAIKLKALRSLACWFAIAMLATYPLSGGEVNPLWERLVIVCFVLLPLGLSYLSEWARRQMQYLLYPVYLVIIAWEVQMGYYNYFGTEEMMTLVLIAVLSGMLEFKRFGHYLAYLGYVAIFVGTGLWLRSELGAEERVTYFSIVLVGLGVSFLMKWRQMKMHRELESSEQMLAEIYASSPDPLLLFRQRDKKLVKYNQRAFELVGVKQQEVLEREVGERVLNRWIEGGQQRLITRYERGEEMSWIEVMASPVNLKDEEYLLVRIVDVSERKKTEDSLRKLNSVMVGRELKMRELKKKLAGKNLSEKEKARNIRT